MNCLPHSIRWLLRHAMGSGFNASLFQLHILMLVTIGSTAPDFTALADSGSTIALNDFRGQTVILYFYPKDDTSGCTAEACDFRDNMQRLVASSAVVLGISPDSVKSHNKFKQKYDLNYALVSDESHEICERYGVWVEKSMYGRKYMGVERATFVIAPDGTITHEWRKVKVPGHVDEILRILSA
jgi:thioredoxin-dependent peroxiredoxin